MKNVNINKKEILKTISPVIEKVSAELGLIPLEIDFSKEAGRWYLRVYIYNNEHPISHKDCENLTKGLEDYLEQLIPVNYYFEVSSPGTERRLKSPIEFEIFSGKKVCVKLRQPLESGLKNFIAKIDGYSSENGVSLKIVDTDEKIEIQEKNIASIRLVADYII